MSYIEKINASLQDFAVEVTVKDEVSLKEYKSKVASQDLIPVQRVEGENIVTRMYDRKKKEYTDKIVGIVSLKTKETNTVILESNSEELEAKDKEIKELKAQLAESNSEELEAKDKEIKELKAQLAESNAQLTEEDKPEEIEGDK